MSVNVERLPSAEILAGVCEAVGLVRTLPAGESIGLETVLVDGGLALDSMAILELLLAVEKRFSCRVAAEEITVEHLGSVGALVALVERKIAEAATDRG